MIHKNDGKKSPHLPEGTPFGLVGTSSMYKRESAPGLGSAEYDGLDPFNSTNEREKINDVVRNLRAQPD